MTEFHGKLIFVVPTHGRGRLAEVCLRQLRRTCVALNHTGLETTAVVVGDSSGTATRLGFTFLQRPNRPLGAKWNHGYEVACRDMGADWVVPLGSDDWVDPKFITSAALPLPGTVRCARRSTIVNPERTAMAELWIPYAGGDGVRIWPRALLEPVGFRPVEEERQRGMDTSMLRRLKARGIKPRMVYHDLHPQQIVDFKSADRQLNTYSDSLTFLQGTELDEPLTRLRIHFPKEAIEEMAAL